MSFNSFITSLFNCIIDKKSSQDDDHITKLKSDDATLQAYRDTAQKQLPYLIKFMSEHERNEKLFRYAIKTNFVEDDNSEHMWVQVSDFKNDYFIGRLANEPATIKLVKYGDDVKVDRDDVEDCILEDFVFKAKVGEFSQEYLRKN